MSLTSSVDWKIISQPCHRHFCLFEKPLFISPADNPLGINGFCSSGLVELRNPCQMIRQVFPGTPRISWDISATFGIARLTSVLSPCYLLISSAT